MMAVSMSEPVVLKRLLAGIADAPELRVDSLSMDSRHIQGRCLFLALRGEQKHGMTFATQAVDAGAVAIVTDLPENDLRVQTLKRTVPVICIGTEKHLPALIASRFFDAPSERMNIVAVTGTNGKSSISWLISAALRELGESSAVMGTLGSGRLDALRKQQLTTPDPVSLQRRLAELNAEGVGFVALEASSHALVQARLAHTDIDIAMFSNLTRDHLDYHRDMDAYFEAKAALFAMPTLSERIISVDDEYGRQLFDRYADEAMAVSTAVLASRPDRFVCVQGAELSVDQTTLQLSSHRGDVEIRSSLIGDFNIQNLCLAFAALLALDVEAMAAAKALGLASPPPGRMQRVSSDKPAVFVDFSHTPDALRGALKTLRQQTVGALVCVFGCGGERDRGKRAEMAQVAEEHADRLVLTSDNPRGEPIDQIFDDMCGGLSREDHVVEPDRRQAIRAAISQAQADDVVLIAGKGHEAVQNIAGESLPFDDVIEARLAMRHRVGEGA
ncbi:MAG: UDP-N-acetylmuramoyl-L-alanyl-D-glutamate--2,6-diaminopimelate ligase [Woeseiaceae bacterium]